MVSIKDFASGAEKVNISLTIDKSLRADLEKFQKQNKINKLSPLLNEVIKEWLHEQIDLLNHTKGRNK